MEFRCYLNQQMQIRSKKSIVTISLIKILFYLLMVELGTFGNIANAMQIINVTATPSSTKDLVMGTNTSVTLTGSVMLTKEEIPKFESLVLCSLVKDLNVARPSSNHVCNNQTLNLQPQMNSFFTSSNSTSFFFNNLTTETIVTKPVGDLYTFNGSFYLYGVLLGRTGVEIFLNQSKDSFFSSFRKLVLIDNYSVTVIRKQRFLDAFFTATVAIFVILINVGFGCMIDVKVIKEIMKKPTVPILGLCCQYIINPLIAYGLLKALSMNVAFSIGMFAYGCCPSGSASNAWTIILKGDLDLSLVVTFASTIAALGFMPLWLFTLGKTLINESIQIPYMNIMISLISLIVPVFIGFLIHRCLPRVAKFFIKLVKPASGFFLLYVCTFGLYVNAFMFKLINWKVIVAGLTMPCCTFTLGAIVAILCRFSYKRVITIAIETAIQNPGIALIMMLVTLPKPDGDIAAIMPIAGSVFTPLPLTITLIGSYIYRKCIATNDNDDSLVVDGKKGNKGIKSITNESYQNNNFIKDEV